MINQTVPVYITDILRSIVAKVQDEVLATIQTNETTALGETAINAIDYQFGHKRELIQTLAQMDADSTLRLYKYPLVYIVLDFREARGKKPGVFASTRLNVIIAHHTDATYKITDRIEKVFKPVIDPIYYSFIRQLAKAPQTLQGNPDMIEHDRWLRSYWGTQAVGGNSAIALNDYVDAVEITNLDLEFNYEPCLPVVP